MIKNILMRIDFQNDFVHPHGALTLNTPELIEKHQKFADNLFHKNFDEIIETYDTHFSETYDQTLEAKSFPLHCIFGSWGWQQAAPFNPELKITKLYKSTTNLWNEIPSYRRLNEDWNNTNVFLCGVLSDVCVKQAMDGLLKRGASVVIINDLCQGCEKQISDILSEDIYRSFIETGKLRTITTAQFFRNTLHDKKTEYNLVNRDLGE